MATKERVELLLKEMDVERVMSTAFNNMQRPLIVEKIQKGSESVKKNAERIENTIAERNKKIVLGIMTRVYSECFSDEEIDILIEIYANPAYKKLMGKSPDIMRRFSEYMLEVQDEMEREIDATIEEVIDSSENASDVTVH